MRFLTGLLLLTSQVLLAQSYQVKVVPVPSWVKPISFEDVQMSDTSGTSGGYHDLLTDEQVNSISHESYYHAAQRVISEKGLENISTLNRSFDPSYQNFAVHYINIYRDGRKINQMQMGKFEVMRRETSMDRLIYDGSLTAIFQIQDLQVGDVLEYAWTVKGTNPVFGDRTCRYFYFNYSMPVGRISVRFIGSANQKFEMRSFNKAPLAHVIEENGNTVYEWKLDHVPALLTEESTPGWHDPYQHIQIGNFGSWQEVSRWGAALFKKPRERLLTKIPGIDGQSQEKDIVRLIEFVQDEIRYLSLSDGIHGFKPHLPSDVLRQRFGDCKDKSFLLVSLLSELGLKSQPVLVDTRSGKTLPDYLPSPYFDHCIVRFELRDSVYWVDPTISLQRGVLSKRSFPNYYYGLVLDSDFSTLVPMPAATPSKTTMHEIFDLDRVGGSANLNVTTTYSGSAADNIRSYFGSNSKDEISRQYLNYYAGDYQDISLKELIKWTDDTPNNVVVSSESYLITAFWEYDSAKHQYAVDIYPRSIAGLLSRPSTILRKNPFFISHPQDFTQEIDLRMPEPWNVEPLVTEIESPAFSYRSKVKYKEEDIVIELTHHYQSRRSFVDPDEIKKHVNKLDEISDHLTFSITYNDQNAAGQSKFNYPYVIILLVIIGISILILTQVHRWDPEVQISSESHPQIGGWLILPAFGLCINPFFMLYQLLTESEGVYFNYTTWSNLFSDTNTVVRLYEYVLAEFVANVCLIIYTGYVAWLMFQRRTSVPYLIVGYYAFNVILLGTDLIVANLLRVNTESDASNDLPRAIISAAIWIPYFMISKRSKGTFTVRRNGPPE